MPRPKHPKNSPHTKPWLDLQATKARVKWKTWKRKMDWTHLENQTFHLQAPDVEYLGTDFWRFWNLQKKRPEWGDEHVSWNPDSWGALPIPLGTRHCSVARLLQRKMHSEGRKPGSLKRKALQFPEEQQNWPCQKKIHGFFRLHFLLPEKNHVSFWKNFGVSL